MYGDQYAIVYENISSLRGNLADGPNSNGARNRATFIGDDVFTEESFTLDPGYNSDSRQNSNLTYGDLFQTADGSYWVYKKQSNGKRPAEDADSWYQIPNTAKNTLHNGPTAIGKMLQKFSLLRGAAATELTTTGGAGTGVFTVLGSVLALGAGWLLFRRRMQIM